jgi:hypothetical protein
VSVSVLHFELRSGIQVAHAFNLSQADLDRVVLGDWRRGEAVVYGDRRWLPDRAQLTIYEGRVLSGPELSFGRGWTNAVKRGEDVTDRLLAAGPAVGAGAGLSPALDALRREVLAQCRCGRIGVHQILWLTNRWYPERRASERLALAEEAVWGLLHEALIGLRRAGPDPAGEAARETAAGGAARETAAGGAARENAAGGAARENAEQAPGEVVAKGDWEGVLLDWRTWADAESPRVLIEAVVSEARSGDGA